MLSLLKKVPHMQALARALQSLQNNGVQTFSNT
jgi:hypothetical protein